MGPTSSISWRAENLPLRAAEEPAAPAGDSLEDIERSHVERVLTRTGWNVSRAAEVLQIDRVTLYNMIRKYGLHR
jgi:transcriptional regulator of acetoin/glycerol metabolism